MEDANPYALRQETQQATYDSTLLTHVKQELEKLKTDVRFANVKPEVMNKVIDTSTKLVENVGSQTWTNVARASLGTTGLFASAAAGFGLSILATPLAALVFPAITASAYLAFTPMQEQTKLKNQIYKKTVELLTKLNGIPKDQQEREISGLKPQSRVRDVIPSAGGSA